MTRAQVRADLIQIEKAGYNPARRDDASYPADVQAAERRVAARAALANADITGMGGIQAPAIDSGSPATAKAGWQSLYRHH
ncbi:DUF4148 domain-containing protein [Caballeronia glebae]|uniref:DUF4148 domain-containing protein n=1 Tax=Caballeronia glebae TaxID=1777143 RepID=UPI0038BBC80F